MASNDYVPINPLSFDTYQYTYWITGMHCMEQTGDGKHTLFLF
jgi:hypothetical protein